MIAAVLAVVTVQVRAQERSGSNQKSKSKTDKHGMKDDWDNDEEDDNPWPLRRFEYGINVGAYFPSKYSANFYNGTPENINNANYVLSNQYWMDEIKKLLGVSATDPVYVNGYPMDMHYNIAMMGGLFLRVNIDRKNGVFLEANYTRLKAGDVITLYAPSYNPNPSTGYQNTRLEQVIGKEGRVMIDLGYQRSFPTAARINLFLQAGVTMCYTQMIESMLVIEGKPYSMVNIYADGNGYIPGTNPQTININQNAFGFGGILGVGAGIPLTSAFSLEPGVNMQYHPVNLQHYSEWRPNFSLYLRILIASGDADE